MKRSSRIVRFALLAALGLSSTACATRRGYAVSWLYSETLNKRLDAHWFMREVVDADGDAAVELMYCPSMPGQPTICRTSVVWERNARSLLNHPRLGPEPPSPER
jgi:hypothetical protein